MTMITMIITWQ